jgi:hypothetical protein
VLLHAKARLQCMCFAGCVGDSSSSLVEQYDSRSKKGLQQGECNRVSATG